jgi:hypothetical protein
LKYIDEDEELMPLHDDEDLEMAKAGLMETSQGMQKMDVYLK